MTTLFHSDFEDSSGTIVVPSGATGWTVPAGQYLVFDASIVSLSAVSGARIMASSDALDKATYTASGLLTDQAVRHAAKWQSHTTPHVSGHLLRYVSSSSYYYVYPETNGSALRLIAYRYEGGSTQIAVTSYVLPCSVGDVIHHESKMVGTTIESRIWKNSESRPSVATLSVTDSNYSSGHPGLIKIGASGIYAAVDQLVITDSAGGEDYFYPESSGPTSAITATTANAVGSLTSKSPPLSAVSATTASLTAAWTSSTGAASSAITATTANTVGALTSTGSTSNGTFTSEVLRDNTGTVVASKALNHVALYNDTTGALVVRKTGLSTNGLGVFTFTDAAITAGTTYRVDWEDVDGRRRMPRKAAT